MGFKLHPVVAQMSRLASVLPGTPTDLIAAFQAIGLGFRPLVSIAQTASAAWDAP